MSICQANYLGCEVRDRAPSMRSREEFPILGAKEMPQGSDTPSNLGMRKNSFPCIWG